MENSTKALLIAAAVLISMILIATGVIITRPSRDVGKQGEEMSKQMNQTLTSAVDKFNQVAGGNVVASVEEDNENETDTNPVVETGNTPTIHSQLLNEKENNITTPGTTNQISDALKNRTNDIVNTNHNTTIDEGNTFSNRINRIITNPNAAILY